MLLTRLINRGLLAGSYPDCNLVRDKLAHLIEQQSMTVYTGFDATASSLHIGNLATLMTSLYFYHYGHQVICVVGDATALVGDPSGHLKDRKKMSKAVIADNAQSIESTLRRLFVNFQAIDKSEFGFKAAKSVKPPIILRNSEWYRKVDMMDFMNNIFREIRVSKELHKRSIQERMKTTGMNSAEFNYPIFQAYDWLELRKRYNCQIQIGGNDQQGNIYTGFDLIKKCLNVRDSVGLLVPLITNSQGKKIGKTTDDSKLGIWLKPELTSPFDLYQYFHRTPDADVGKLLRIFSLFTEEQINSMIEKHLGDKSDIWYCQRKLAEHVCLIVHGFEGLSEAQRITKSLFPKNKT